MSVSIRVWDLPLRLFHWLLALSVLSVVISGELGGNLIDWHGRIGELVLGLLVFRLIWGFVGTTHARFASFFPTPAKIAAYLKGQWQGIGHNPLGALSAIALLGALAAVVVTGLFANDDIAFQGPLFTLVDKSFSDKLSGLHARAFYALIVLIPLHLAAIVYYIRIKKHNLIAPMLTGKKVVPRSHAVQISGGGAIRFLAALTIAGFVVWGVSNGASYLVPLPAPAATPSF
ncbi:MAG: cytochrome b/b6 domain-containing protein [Gallionella sp.]|jgi:cytochrome b